MNNITQQQILDTLENLIEYEEISRILEHDLNMIAEQVDVPIEFSVFFDAGEFDTTIKSQSLGEGQGNVIIPVLITLIGGDYSTQSGPQAYSTSFRIESFGYTKYRKELRRIFETYSKFYHGQILDGMFNSSLTTSYTDFPITTEDVPYKGEERFSIWLMWNLTFIYEGQLANSMTYKLDNNEIKIQSLAIKRSREISTAHKNSNDETSTIPNSQSLGLNGTALFDGSEGHKKIIRNIKNLGHGLDETFTLEITYPNILNEQEEPDIDTYDVCIIDGDVEINDGGYIVITFAMATV